MTFNFNTYSADVQFTPKSVLKVADIDGLETLALQLPSIAFKHNQGSVQPDTSTNNASAKYAAQIFYLYTSVTNEAADWAAIVGFTWKIENGEGKDMHFGIYEFAKPTGTATSSTTISNIKIYKCVYDSTLQLNYNTSKDVTVNSLTTTYTRTGISTVGDDGNTVLGYEYKHTASIDTYNFYIPPKSFFLEGKHVDVTIPFVSGSNANPINAVPSKVFYGV